jgi:hypothetical protein
MSDHPEHKSDTVLTVGYKRPPVHSRFKPGQSGNPSGRGKGSQNLKTLFHRILKEEISLREGADVKKVTKAEAVMRGLVIGALKGDVRSIGALLRIAELTGQFEEPATDITTIRRVIVNWKEPEQPFPASSDNSKEPA